MVTLIVLATIATLTGLAVFLALMGLRSWLKAQTGLEGPLSGKLGAGPQWRAASTTATPSPAAGAGRWRRLSLVQRAEADLIAADSKLTVREYFLTRIGLALVGLLLAWLGTRQVPVGLLAALIGWVAPALQLRRRRAARLRQFEDNFPNVLDLLVGSLRAGQGLLHAIQIVAQEMPEPVASEFDRVVRETSLGYSLQDALDHLVERVGSEDLHMTVTAIQINYEVGGNLAEVLHTISETIRDRLRLTRMIRAVTAQQRMTGTILILLPFILGAILMVLNPSYMMAMFQPGWPLLIPAYAVGSVLIGALIMRQMMRLEV
ncbi:MAG: type II secretion system F family protein [Caldilineales bacterium]|nr:type II secretion system F family protein [Caldilineales bacterium]MCX7853467.1 type II secretion system F family protein [Caldilineales bacterium]